MQEGLFRERDCIGARRPPGTTACFQWQQSLRHPKIGKQGPGLVVAKITACNRPNAIIGERNKMIIPRNQLSGLVKSGFKMMESSDTIKIVSEVVFAGPL